MSSVRDVARQLRPPVVSPPLEVIWGVVTATHTAPNTVDVKLNGRTTVTLALRYRSGYAPAINDVVKVEVRGKDLLVWGTMA